LEEETMSITRLAVGAVLVSSLAAAHVAAAAPAPQQLLDQMAAQFSKVTDYEVIVDGTSREGAKEVVQRYRFAYKRPGMIRLRTLAGENKDGELCVRPDGTIRGRKNSGVIKVFAITMSRSDRRLRDSEGVGIWEMDYGSLMNRLKTKIQAPGNQASVTDRPNGIYQLELHYGGGKMAGCVDRYWIDSRSFWITSWERMKNNALLERNTYSNLRLNPGFSNGYFEF
jgi:outer membrane lipoprotein-sorting protein